MAALHKALDTVEAAAPGPACLVCAGTGDKMFSTGFNLKWWAKEGIVPQWQSILAIQKLYDRILTFPMPTMCVMNGLTIAGGLLFALMFDFRVMSI